MDEQQLRRIIREVLQRVLQEDDLTAGTGPSSLPKAYFIFPKNWQNVESSQYLPALKAADGRYEKVIVLPERDENEERFSDVGAYTVAAYSDLCAPAEESITIFPIPCRDLVIKTALCLSEDFETCWVRKCIENGLSIYMKKESEMFTGKEPAAYRKKILSYYQDAKSYGICFSDEEDLHQNRGNDTGMVHRKIQTKTRFITTQDLRDIPQHGEFLLHTGDVLTALAKEHIEKFGIRIVEE